MSEPTGRNRWAIAEATSPPGPTAPSRQFTSHETACVLNASEEAHVEITIYFSHREPVSLFAHSSVSRPRAPNR
ncbi:MAG: sensory rhodopsin transducer [Actinomycetota bacterium]|nr:sensory rhodopsin transducer [Actinomycetota bacterium]